MLFCFNSLFYKRTEQKHANSSYRYRTVRDSAEWDSQSLEYEWRSRWYRLYTNIIRIRDNNIDLMRHFVSHEKSVTIPMNICVCLSVRLVCLLCLGYITKKLFYAVFLPCSTYLPSYFLFTTLNLVFLVMNKYAPSPWHWRCTTKQVLNDLPKMSNNVLFT